MTEKKKVMAQETLTATATVGGRLATLDPIRLLPITLTIREVESTMLCGFQTSWGETSVDGERLEILVGAGLGSGWGTMTFRGKRYCFAVSEIVEGFLNALSSLTLDEKGRSSND